MICMNTNLFLQMELDMPESELLQEIASDKQTRRAQICNTHRSEDTLESLSQQFKGASAQLKAAMSEQRERQEKLLSILSNMTTHGASGNDLGSCQELMSALTSTMEAKADADKILQDGILNNISILNQVTNIVLDNTETADQKDNENLLSKLSDLNQQVCKTFGVTEIPGLDNKTKS